MIILLFFGVNTAYAGGADTTKVGVVLSGGGAKGFAHIGALKVIEEAGVEVDYIGGTSMGAIIGGLYALGYSLEEIEEIVVSTNFPELISDKVSRRYSPFFFRYFGDYYGLKFNFSSGKIIFPNALSRGQSFFNFLSKVTFPRNIEHDFTNFDIPFFCMVTDIENGTSHVLENGYFPKSVRASGALPALFSPVILDSLYVADGGILNNFPADIMKEKGVDKIIGISVESELKDRSFIKNPADVITQVSSFQFVHESREHYELCDVMIHPDMNDYSVTDFDMVDSFITIGYNESKKYFDTLLNISRIQSGRRNENNDAFEFGGGEEDFVIDSLVWQLSNSDREAEDFYEYLPSGEGLNINDFLEGIDRMNGSDLYSFIDYSFSGNDTGGIVATVAPITKRGFNQQFKIGGNYNMEDRSRLLLNYTTRNQILNNSIASIDLILTNALEYRFRYFVDGDALLDPGFSSELFLSNINFELDQAFPITEDLLIRKFRLKHFKLRNELYFKFGRQNNFWPLFKVRFNRVKLTFEDYLDDASNEIDFSQSGHFLSGGFQMKRDDRNRLYFADRGSLFDIFAYVIKPLNSSEYLFQEGSKKASFNVQCMLEKKFSITENSLLGIRFSAVASTEVENADNLFFVGGQHVNETYNFKPFKGIKRGNIITSDYLSAGLNYSFKVHDNHYLSAFLDGIIFDDFRDLNGFNSVLSGSVGYTFLTFVGPVQVIYSYSGRDPVNFYINLGHWF